MKCSGGLSSLSRCTSFLKAAGRSMPAYSSWDSFVLECLNTVLFLIVLYLHFLFQDAVKALNTLQTNAQDLEQIRRSRGRLARDNLPQMRSFTERAGVKVSPFYNYCLVGLIELA